MRDKSGHVVMKTEHYEDIGSLIDSGSNCGIARSNTCVTSHSGQYTNVTGTKGNTINGMPIGSIGAVIPSMKGEVIAIMHQWAMSNGQWKNILTDFLMAIAASIRIFPIT